MRNFSYENDPRPDLFGASFQTSLRSYELLQNLLSGKRYAEIATQTFGRLSVCQDDLGISVFTQEREVELFRMSSNGKVLKNKATIEILGEGKFLASAEEFTDILRNAKVYQDFVRLVQNDEVREFKLRNLSKIKITRLQGGFVIDHPEGKLLLLYRDQELSGPKSADYYNWMNRLEGCLREIEQCRDLDRLKKIDKLLSGFLQFQFSLPDMDINILVEEKLYKISSSSWGELPIIVGRQGQIRDNPYPDIDLDDVLQRLVKEYGESFGK